MRDFATVDDLQKSYGHWLSITTQLKIKIMVARRLEKKLSFVDAASDGIYTNEFRRLISVVYVLSKSHSSPKAQVILKLLYHQWIFVRVKDIQLQCP